MRYSINYRAPLGGELLRYLEALVDDLVLELLRTRYDLQAGIHGARKLVKEIRAVLRLLKPLRGEAHADNWQLLKSIAVATSELRDDHVSEQLWKALGADLRDHPDHARIAERLSEHRLQRAREKLQDGVDRTVEELQVLSTLLLQRKQSLLDAQATVAVDASWLAARFGRLYRKIVAAHEAARGGDDVDKRHDLRKDCKDVLYALRLCNTRGKGELQGFADDLGEVADWLGDANDLCVLRDRVVPLAVGDPEGLENLLRQRRGRLWKSADERLGRLLALDRSRFVRLILDRLA